MVHQSPTIGELAKALAAAQSELEPAKRESVNPAFRSRYADLAACVEAVRAPLARHGLALTQLLGGDGEHVTLTTMLLHTSGEFIGSTSTVRLTKLDATAVGSATTYLRRYGLSAIVGLSTEDDDGAAAAQHAPTASLAPATPRAAPERAAPSPEVQRAAQSVASAFPGASTSYASTSGEPSCPKCNGRMWDNRTERDGSPKKNPKAPDFKCRSKECDGAIWPPRQPRTPARVEAAPVPDGPLPDLDDTPF